MGLQAKNKVDPAFSMSSMTDIIFLLLIFFMLTSSFITPSGLPVNLKDKKGQVVLHIDKDVPVEYLVEIGGIAAGLEANVSIATKPF